MPDKSQVHLPWDPVSHSNRKCAPQAVWGGTSHFCTCFAIKNWFLFEQERDNLLFTEPAANLKLMATRLCSHGVCALTTYSKAYSACSADSSTCTPHHSSCLNVRATANLLAANIKQQGPASQLWRNFLLWSINFYLPLTYKVESKYMALKYP